MGSALLHLCTSRVLYPGSVEASLSFLGFGLPTTVPSWGGMLSREGKQFMEMAPRLAIGPGVALTVVVYCVNMFGDAVRDLLDPQAVGRRRWRRPGRRRHERTGGRGGAAGAGGGGAVRLTPAAWSA